MGRLIRGLAAEGNLRVLAAETTDIVEEARSRHGLSPTATAALGRAMSGVLLLAFLLSKTPKERIGLQFLGDGPLGGPVVEAGPDGSVRGYVKNPSAHPPLRPDGKLDVGAAIGRGELKVDRLLANEELYQSSVELVSGEVAEDLVRYLWQSEQIPSALLLGVRVAPTGEVAAAGGVVIQVLPGCPEEVIDRLEQNLKGQNLTPLLLEQGLEGAVETLLQGLSYQPTDLRAVGYPEGHIPLAFRCRCSRERALRALVYFTSQEREEMIAQDGGAEVLCHWCGTRYRITPEEIRSIDGETQAQGEVPKA
ncbi:MAG: Hsp33 family molecular chaperone HslO [Meiothermus sp.]|uniref:Hsp33 family molecular chaperone HslO n=1 Tax=Meiothermus sp. TaxID=1955249 RepID=UPI0025DB0843|nr:Hsp33 family molecular chaperone HslO [Meiothermus sp.]MCS7057720.1 Hsp33 family molecular chaperone HslO [Meiothermus sp.]MCS7193387.1 Hsp33 family molecular chaperone HslO [Meiothermus sp.]MCX7739804.1 Hsp33 family molecular chaperone HslO [Meiothermus sp.]MDW8090900.1 Hsp33 family molecular chaperone HslO [Meiothermus sp.]MDW8482038.1 Hsp33 family molecular chaperone HslO [Meiothermus sp.]